MNEKRYRDEHAVHRPTFTPAVASTTTLKSLKLPPYSPLETKVATMLCQFGRVTRDMPSQAEIENAIPYARSLIALVKKG